MKLAGRKSPLNTPAVVSVLRVASGPRVKLASCKSAFNRAVVYSTDRSKAVVQVLILLFGALRFILRFVVCLTLCHFVQFFSPFSIAITSLGEERANLSAFRTFDRFVLVWLCRFPLPLDVWEGLRFVIVALPRLFSYHLFHSTDRSKAVAPVLVLLFVALRFILRGDLF